MRAGRGNYLANASLGQMNYNDWCDGSYGNGLYSCCAFPDSQGWPSVLRGVMGANVSLRTSDIGDGLSHTILVAETKAGHRALRSAGRVGEVRRFQFALGGRLVHGRWQRAQLPGGGDNVPSCGDIAVRSPF